MSFSLRLSTPAAPSGYPSIHPFHGLTYRALLTRIAIVNDPPASHLPSSSVGLSSPPARGAQVETFPPPLVAFPPPKRSAAAASSKARSREPDRAGEAGPSGKKARRRPAGVDGGDEDVEEGLEAGARLMDEVSNERGRRSKLVGVSLDCLASHGFGEDGLDGGEGKRCGIERAARGKRQRRRVACCFSLSISLSLYLSLSLACLFTFPPLHTAYYQSWPRRPVADMSPPSSLPHSAAHRRRSSSSTSHRDHRPPQRQAPPPPAPRQLPSSLHWHPPPPPSISPSSHRGHPRPCPSNSTTRMRRATRSSRCRSATPR